MINIEGIRVLNTYVTKSPELALIIVLIFTSIAMIALGIWCFNEYGVGCECIICIIFAVLTIFMSVIGIKFRTSITHYDVLIDNSVSFVEVYDKYKIESKNGDIYHLILLDEPQEDKANDQ